MNSVLALAPANCAEPKAKGAQQRECALLRSNLCQLCRAVQILIGLVFLRTHQAAICLAVSFEDCLQNALTALVVHPPETNRSGKTDFRCIVAEGLLQLREEGHFLAGGHRGYCGQANIPILILFRIAQRTYGLRKIPECSKRSNGVDPHWLRLRRFV